MEKWGSVLGPLFCVRMDVGAAGAGTQNFGPKRFFPPIIPRSPHLSTQNDQRDVGIILSHRCRVDPPPPRTGRSGIPALNPPPVTAAKEGGRGVGKMGLRVTPPPRRAIFFPPKKFYSEPVKE